MDRKVYFCLKLIADTLALNLESVLDDYYFGHSTESQTLDNFGASVLRVYSYDPQTEPQQPTGCGIHADLGLLTLAPRATHAGLRLWQPQTQEWVNVEENTQENQCILFAGETLGLLSNGLIRAPLHCVSYASEDGQQSRRMSMPFFLRAKPSAKLPDQQTTHDFMQRVFTQRAWRRGKQRTPDY